MYWHYRSGPGQSGTMIEALYCRAMVVDGDSLAGWLLSIVGWGGVGGPHNCRLRVGFRSSGQGKQQQSSTLATTRLTKPGQHQGGNARVGAGPGHKPSTKLEPHIYVYHISNFILIIYFYFFFHCYFIFNFLLFNCFFFSFFTLIFLNF